MLLPVTKVAEWVKGHYTGDNREYTHDLNNTVDKLAGAFNKSPPRLRHRKLPCSIPGYSIRLLNNGSTISTKLYSTMSIALHRTSYIVYLKTKHGWTDSTFEPIHWDAHELAYKGLPRNS